ncbi:MAG TPA: type III polyketide synthase [Cytophagaceae bacterium]|nr:type III polyketide synthase [Cytophagaceae bacterium]
MSSYINSIGIANPIHKHGQKDILSFMLHDGAAIEQQKKLKAAFRASGVETRYSVLPDFGTALNDTSFLNGRPLVEERMQIYKREALSLSIQAINKCLQKTNTVKKENITHLITVSCTGMYAPGLDIDIISALQLPHTTARACLNFMGCNAAINALRMADAIVLSNDNALVLVVCAELCTLHYQPSTSDDSVLSNTLFSDGAAAVLLSNEKEGSLFKVKQFHAALCREGNSDMCWDITSRGFEMILSSYVPDLLNTGIQHLLKESAFDVEASHHIALHPGGKKILDTLLKTLNKGERDLTDSYAVLKNYGNMSSPTILFVLYNMLSNASVKKNESISVMSFGPGLTIEAMLLERY